MRYSIHSTRYYDNGVAYIISTLNNGINILFEQLRYTYLELNPDTDIPVVLKKYSLNELSFKFIGLSVISFLYFLIDLYTYSLDGTNHAALLEITDAIVSEIPDAMLPEIRVALTKRYNGLDNKLYKLLIEE